MSIQTEIARLTNAKSRLRAAIQSKGVAVPADAKIDAWADYVRQIPSKPIVLQPDDGEIALYPTWPMDETNCKPDLTFTLYDVGGEFVKTSEFTTFQWPGFSYDRYYGSVFFLDDLWNEFYAKYGTPSKNIWGEVLVSGSVYVKEYGGVWKFSGCLSDLDTDNNGPGGLGGAFKIYLK